MAAKKATTKKKATTRRKTTRKAAPKKFKQPKETSVPAAPKAAYKRTRKDANDVLLAQRQKHGKEMHKALMVGVLQLNQNIIDRLVIAFERGHHATSAIRSIGIPHAKFKGWLTQGARDAENYELIIKNGGSIDPKKMSMEYQLLARLNMANFTFEDVLLQKIINADHWQAHALILSKKYPDRWGDKQKIEITSTSLSTHVFITPREATMEEWQEEQLRLAGGTKFINVEETNETGVEDDTETGDDL